MIDQTDLWAVQHCVGPLGVGTLIVKPKRHVVHVWDLDEDEAAELGPLLRRVSGAVAEVFVSPGNTAFAVMPSAATSFASPLMNPMMPIFVAM